MKMLIALAMVIAGVIALAIPAGAEAETGPYDVLDQTGQYRGGIPSGSLGVI